MPDIIERPCKLFEAGDYPDKGVTVSEDDLDALISSYVEVPVKVEHVDSVFDGLLGTVKRIWREGKDLMGSIGFSPEAWAMIDKLTKLPGLSVGLMKDKSALTEVSLVRTPRVASAAVFGESVVVFTTDADFSTKDTPEEPGDQTKEADMPEEKQTYTKEELDALLAERDANEVKMANEFAALNKRMRTMQSEVVVNDWLAKGKIAPAGAEFATEILCHTDEVVKFGDGEESVASLFTKFVDAMPNAVQFGEQGKEKVDEAKFDAKAVEILMAASPGRTKEEAIAMLAAVDGGK